MKETVHIVNNLIDGQDGLTAVQNVIMRNKPDDCLLSIGSLTGQVLKTVVRNLRDSNAFLANFPNGDKLVFLGRLPPFVSAESATRIVLEQS